MIRRIPGTCFVLAGLLWLVSAVAGHAQQPGSYVTPPPEAKEPTAPRFHLGVGYQGSLALVEPKGLNDLAGMFGTGGFDIARYIHGVAGVLRYDADFPRLMFGAHALFSSSTRRSSGRVTGIDVERSARFSVTSLGGEVNGVLLEGVTSSFLVGCGIGHDAYTVEMTQTRDDGEPLGNIVDEEWDLNSSNNSVGRYLKLTSGVLVLHPMASVELHTYDAPSFKARISVGYRVATSRPEWTSASGRAVGNVPLIDASGLTIGATVYMGLFLQ